MTIHHRLFTAVLPATSAILVLALACAAEWVGVTPDAAAKPVITDRPSTAPAQEATRSRDNFVSGEGRYTLPIAWSTSVVLQGIGGDELKWQAVRAHSAAELWTKVLAPLDERSIAPVSTDEGVGWDTFVRYYGEHVAQLQIVWAPKPAASLARDFREATAFHKKIGTWIPGSERGVRIGGFRALSGHFVASTPRGIMNGTLILVHAGERRYQIQFSYTNGFNDPEDTFEKLVRMRFEEVPIKTASARR